MECEAADTDACQGQNTRLTQRHHQGMLVHGMMKPANRFQKPAHGKRER